MKNHILTLCLVIAAALSSSIVYAQSGGEYISLAGYIDAKSQPVLETIAADGTITLKSLEAGKGLLGMVKSLESIRRELVLQLNAYSEQGYEPVSSLSDYHLILRKKD